MAYVSLDPSSIEMLAGATRSDDFRPGSFTQNVGRALWRGFAVALLGWTVSMASPGLSMSAVGMTAKAERAQEPTELLRPSTNQTGPDILPASRAHPVTDYVIFKSVPFGKGRVQTGWHYKDNEQQAPDWQSCHYIEAINTSAGSILLLGYNGKFQAPEIPPPTLDVKAAYTNCVWRDLPK